MEPIAPERTETRDEKTGARVIQLTNAPCINHPLYYLANSFSPDASELVFASNRNGRYDLFTVEIESGTIRQLTDIDGIYPFSGNVVGENVFFTTDQGDVYRVPLSGNSATVLASRPECGLGEVTINATGELGCCLISEEGKAGLLVFKTDGSDSWVILNGVRALYHPQFHPTDPKQLIYSADPPDPRLWAVQIDGSQDRCFYANRPDEWFVHETFLGVSDHLIVVCWHRGLLEVHLQTGDIRTIREFSAWHISSNPTGTQIVCDTHLPDIGLCLIDPKTGKYQTLCHPNATNQGHQWPQPTPLMADGEAPGWATMTEVVTATSAYGPQWSHPHPAFSPDGKWVSFTSDQTGHPQVYVVEVSTTR
jgi:oligogalacturonide lyase